MSGSLRLRSLSVKLALVLFLIVVTAMGIVYAVLVPRLETRLVDAKINDLARADAPVQAGIARTMPYPQDAVEFFAASLNARVVVYGPLGFSGSRVVADSNRLDSSDTEDDPVARRARLSGAVERGRIARGEGQFAEVAFPLRGSRGTVVLLSASLRDALANVRLVRRSVIFAGVVALLTSLLAGSFAAWRFTRRIRRLEVAAERLAGGDFGAPIFDSGEDEVGQLARAFEHMRSRLAQLDHARREFIANASHELRTPIFSLGGFLELFADEELDEDTRHEFLAEMRGQVDRMTRLATDLLDLSRLDAGQLGIETTELDLASIAGVLVDEFRPVAELAGHDLRSEAEVPVYALADAQRVLRVGRALVENALRHTPAGTAVTITAGEAGGGATLAVRDEGAGIAEADRDHLFQRFYRGGSAVHASGSGLGLAIARELAELMDGSIDVESNSRETVFILTLPAATEAFSRRKTERPALRQPAGA
jgi:signal transduction histidine kinase